MSPHRQSVTKLHLPTSASAFASASAAAAPASAFVSAAAFALASAATALVTVADELLENVSEGGITLLEAVGLFARIIRPSMITWVQRTVQLNHAQVSAMRDAINRVRALELESHDTIPAAAAELKEFVELLSTLKHHGNVD